MNVVEVAVSMPDVLKLVDTVALTEGVTRPILPARCSVIQISFWLPSMISSGPHSELGRPYSIKASESGTYFTTFPASYSVNQITP